MIAVRLINHNREIKRRGDVNSGYAPLSCDWG